MEHWMRLYDVSTGIQKNVFLVKNIYPILGVFLVYTEEYMKNTPKTGIFESGGYEK